MTSNRNLNRPVIIAAVIGVLAVSVYAIITATPGKKESAEATDGAAPTVAGSETKPAATKPPEAQSVANQESKGADSAATTSKKANDPAAAKSDAGGAPNDLTRFNGKPYKVYPDGKVNFSTYRGYNMYSSICFVCHGPSALGSSFAPALVDSLKVLSYDDFVATVMNGRVNISSTSNNAMPSFGDNPTVAKYIDSLYAYIKGRADGALPRGELNWEGPKDE